MFDKVWSTLFQLALAIGITILIVLLVAHLPLTEPFVGSFDAELEAFRLTFTGG